MTVIHGFIILKFLLLTTDLSLGLLFSSPEPKARR